VKETYRFEGAQRRRFIIIEKLSFQKEKKILIWLFYEPILAENGCLKHNFLNFNSEVVLKNLQKVKLKWICKFPFTLIHLFFTIRKNGFSSQNFVSIEGRAPLGHLLHGRERRRRRLVQQRKTLRGKKRV